MVLTNLTMLVLLTTICRHGAAPPELADIPSQQAASNSPKGSYSLAFLCGVVQRHCRKNSGLHRLQLRVGIAQ